MTNSLNGWQPVQNQLTHNLFGVGEDVSDGGVNCASVPRHTEFKEGDDTEEPIVEENAPADLTSNKGIQEVLSHVSLYYSNCSDGVKFTVGATPIKLKQLVPEVVKNISTMTINTQNATQDSVMWATRNRNFSVSVCICSQDRGIWIKWENAVESLRT